MPSWRLTHKELETLWIAQGGSIGAADTAAAIAQAESGGCQYALAGPKDIRPVKQCTYRKTATENSCGFWQINLQAHHNYKAPGIFNQAENARAAIAISSDGLNFAPWTTYNNGAYKQYLETPAVTPPVAPGAGGSPSPSQATGAWTNFVHVLAHNGPQAHRRITKATARARKIGRK